MTIRAALRFPFRGPRPWNNILLLGVCYLIPMIGPLVALGYGALVEKVLARNLDAEAPLFEFANFMKYLERGVAPFVVSLIASVVLIPMIVAIWFAGFLLVIFATGSKMSPWVVVPGALLAFLTFMLVMLLWTLCAMPLLLRASLLGKIGDALDFRWCLDFLRRVFWPALGYLLLMQVIAFPCLLVGMCALYVGAFFAMAMIIFVQLHIRMQLYHLYLDRGGVPLAFIDEPIPPAFPVVRRPAG